MSSAADPTAPTAPDDELQPGTRRALLHRLAVGQAEGRTPSVTAAVVRAGRLAWCGARTMSGEPGAASDVQYRIGSISKTLIAIMVMRLRDEGLLDLADPLRKHLVAGQAGGLDHGEIARLLETGQVGDLTVAQLLSHTAGLPAEATGPWWERTPGTLRPELADVFPGRPHVHPAGRVFHYSNPGYAVLGGLITQVRGQNWGEALRREVLEPLGMTRTTLLPRPPHEQGWAVHPWADVLQPEPAEDTGRMAPAGQYWSTAADMGRLASFLLDGDDRVLAASTLAEMRAPASGPDQDWAIGYGLGIQLVRKDGQLFYGHSGSMPGFVSAVWASEQDGLGAVALANATTGAKAVMIALDLIGIVAEREPTLPAPWKPLPEVDQDLLGLTGVWYWGPRPFALRLLADRTIDLSPVGGRNSRTSRYRPEPDGTWTGLDDYFDGETLRLVRGPDGAVDHIDVGTFVFTREPYGPDSPPAARPAPHGWQPA
jgi:CubicO group peptidase (beta-lactamase class C family)